MADFRNRSPCLGRVVPNNFKDFICYFVDSFFVKYTLETSDKLELLSLIDILVDGRFDKAKRNLMLQFRGSSNQRIIDVQKSLKTGEVIIWDRLNDGTESFEQVNRDKTE